MPQHMKMMRKGGFCLVLCRLSSTFVMQRLFLTSLCSLLHPYGSVSSMQSFVIAVFRSLTASAHILDVSLTQPRPMLL